MTLQQEGLSRSKWVEVMGHFKMIGLVYMDRV